MKNVTTWKMCMHYLAGVKDYKSLNRIFTAADILKK